MSFSCTLGLLSSSQPSSRAWETVSLGGWWTQTGDALYLRNGIIDHTGGNDDVQAMASSRNAQVLGFASTLGGIKAFADGSLGSRTAYMEKPWPGEPDNYGYHTYESVDWLADRFRKADENGLWIWTHAIGDRANKEVLDAFEQAGVAVSKGHAHHRIEHAQFLRPQDVERFANLGITASVQPSHLDLDIGKLKTVFPTPHPRSYAFKSLLESGAELNFGSDAPVENPDALKGIAFAAFRTQISRSCRGIF